MGIKTSKSIDISCGVIAEANQCDSDLYLVELVRIQQTADTIISSLYDTDEEVDPNTAVTSMTFKYLEKEICKHKDLTHRNASIQCQFMTYPTLAFSADQ